MIRWLSRKREQTPEASGQRPLYVLSQRGPLSFDMDEEGILQASPAGGGLASAFGAIAEHRPLHWIAVAISDADRLAASRNQSIRAGLTDLHLVALPPAVERLHYWAFANPLLWLVQHGLADQLVRPRSWQSIARAWRSGYEPANLALAKRVAEVAGNEPNPIILVQDYHFYLAPRIIRGMLPDALIGHFVHIPWPDPEAWAVLPRPIVEQMLAGLLGADVLGFQTPGDAERFLATCRAYAGDRGLGVGGWGSGTHPTLSSQNTLVRHYPITVDASHLERWAAAPEAKPYHRALEANPEMPVGRADGQAASESYHRSVQASGGMQVGRADGQAASESYHRSVQASGGMQTIVRVDRLDPIKNIPAGFRAFGVLLERRPDLRGHVRFLAHLVPSRTELPEYRAARREALAAANWVNEHFGLPGWRPIQVLYEENRPLASALLSHYDVLLVNSVADGMHLVAKEGAVLNQRDGVLVLSRRTGAWEELGPWALGVDPTDIEGTAGALEMALAMPPGERWRRAQGLREAVRRTSLDRWLNQQLTDLGQARGRRRSGRRAAPA